MFFNPKDILQIIFPTKCLSCFSYTKNQELLCDHCFNNLEIYQHFVCIKCRKPINLFTSEQCCENQDFQFKNLLYCLNYQNKIVKEFIHQFKYQRLLNLQTLFKRIIKISLKDYLHYFKNNNYVIIPVPLNIYRERKRGFNQSIILAKIISNILHIPYHKHVLIRYKNNPPQANIKNQSQRNQNVKNVFKFNNKQLKLIKNKNIILVDDVFTTGSTLNECAIILKQNQAKNIIVICLAH